MSIKGDVTDEKASIPLDIHVNSPFGKPSEVKVATTQPMDLSVTAIKGCPAALTSGNATITAKLSNIGAMTAALSIAAKSGLESADLRVGTGAGANNSARKLR